MSVSPISSTPPPSPSATLTAALAAGRPRPEARAESANRELTSEEQTDVREFQARDREVKAHEQAHQAAGGRYAGAPSYEYETGPDNVRYAVGGEVQIDNAPVQGDPAATIKKMQVVRSAALAPVEPSVQDQRVAQQASVEEAKARQEVEAAKQEKTQAQGPSPVAAAYASTDPKLGPGFVFDLVG